MSEQNQTNTPSVEVRASESGVVVQVGAVGKTENAGTPAAPVVRGVAVTSESVVGLQFHVALNDAGEIVRSVTVNPFDRQLVAQLVAGWITDGFRVERVDVAGLRRLLTAAAKAGKALAETLITTEGGGAPAAPDTGSASSSDASGSASAASGEAGASGTAGGEAAPAVELQAA